MPTRRPTTPRTAPTKQSVTEARAALEAEGILWVPDHSLGEPWTGNLLIHAENSRALHVLGQRYRDRVRCIYIDPPYNNQEHYGHYDDSESHESWLASLRDRLPLLRNLLTSNGSLWISIDDREMHYLKTVADGVFGRENFVTTIVWQHRTTRENRKVFSNNHEYILVYAKEARSFGQHRNHFELTDELLERYKNLDDDPRGPWQSVSVNVQDGHGTPAQHYALVAPNGKRHSPPKGRCWAYTRTRMNELIADGRVWFGRDGSAVPRLKKFLSETTRGLTPDTLWLATDVGTTDEAKKHLNRILPDAKVFDTPKPESLIRRILNIATDPGDLVLDAYLGSGTTAATAHKMARRYIGIEQGEHIVSHCVERLRAVVEGIDTGGITQAESWVGGGGFEFFRLDNSETRKPSVLARKPARQSTAPRAGR